MKKITIILALVILFFCGSSEAGVFKKLAEATQNAKVGKVLGTLDELEDAHKLRRVEKVEDTQPLLENLKKSNLFNTSSLNELEAALKKMSLEEQVSILKPLEAISKFANKIDDWHIDIEQIQKVIAKQGDSVLDYCALCENEKAFKACLNGFEKYGDDFENIVKKFDPESWDDIGKSLEKVNKADLSKILKEPTKYFSSVGKPTKNFPKPKNPWSKIKPVLTWSAVLTVFSCILPDSWLPGVPDPLRWGARSLLLIVAIYFLWPFILGIFIYILRFGIWFLGIAYTKLFSSKEKADTGELWWQKLLRKLPFNEIRGKTGKDTPIRIGLCAVQRVGKSTTIAVLSKVLPAIEPGCSISAQFDKDQQVLDSIINEVSSGKATTENKTVNLNIIWPDTYSGKLEIHDFRGEDLRTTAQRECRRNVVHNLKIADALMVSIDPTMLEKPNEADRSKDQKDAIQSLFNAEWLDMGRRFLRPICIVINKIDILTNKDIDRMYQAQCNVLGDSFTTEDLARTKELLAMAKEGNYTSDDSRELGKKLLSLWEPTMYQRYSVQMEQTNTLINSTPSFLVRIKRIFWPCRQCVGSLEVFAVSTLGKTLGKQSEEILKKRSEWKNNPALPEPTDRMDLDAVNVYCRETSIVHPFKWMLDHIPSGWINQLRNYRSPLLRYKVHTRFAKSEAIRQDIIIGRRCAISTMLSIFFLVFMWAWIVQPYWNRQSTFENQKTVRTYFNEYGKFTNPTPQMWDEWKTFTENDWPTLRDYSLDDNRFVYGNEQSQFDNWLRSWENYREAKKKAGDVLQQVRVMGKYPYLNTIIDGCGKPAENLFSPLIEVVCKQAAQDWGSINELVDNTCQEYQEKQQYDKIIELQNAYEDSLNLYKEEYGNADQCSGNRGVLSRNLNEYWKKLDSKKKEIGYIQFGEELKKEPEIPKQIDKIIAAVDAGRFPEDQSGLLKDRLLQELLPNYCKVGDQNNIEKLKEIEDNLTNWNLSPSLKGKIDNYRKSVNEQIINYYLREKYATDQNKYESLKSIKPRFNGLENTELYQNYTEAIRAAADNIIESVLPKESTPAQPEEVRSNLDNVKLYVSDCSDSIQSKWEDAVIQTHRQLGKWDDLLHYSSLSDKRPTIWKAYLEKLDELLKTPGKIESDWDKFKTSKENTLEFGEIPDEVLAFYDNWNAYVRISVAIEKAEKDPERRKEILLEAQGFLNSLRKESEYVGKYQPVADQWIKMLLDSDLTYEDVAKLDQLKYPILESSQSVIAEKARHILEQDFQNKVLTPASEVIDNKEASWKDVNEKIESLKNNWNRFETEPRLEGKKNQWFDLLKRAWSRDDTPLLDTLDGYKYISEKDNCPEDCLRVLKETFQTKALQEDVENVWKLDIPQVICEESFCKEVLKKWDVDTLYTKNGGGTPPFQNALKLVLEEKLNEELGAVQAQLGSTENPTEGISWQDRIHKCLKYSAALDEEKKVQTRAKAWDLYQKKLEELRKNVPDMEGIWNSFKSAKDNTNDHGEIPESINQYYEDWDAYVKLSAKITQAEKDPTQKKAILFQAQEFLVSFNPQSENADSYREITGKWLEALKKSGLTKEDVTLLDHLNAPILDKSEINKIATQILIDDFQKTVLEPAKNVIENKDAKWEDVEKQIVNLKNSADRFGKESRLEEKKDDWFRILTSAWSRSDASLVKCLEGFNFIAAYPTQTDRKNQLKQSFQEKALEADVNDVLPLTIPKDIADDDFCKKLLKKWDIDTLYNKKKDLPVLFQKAGNIVFEEKLKDETDSIVTKAKNGELTDAQRDKLNEQIAKLLMYHQEFNDENHEKEKGRLVDAVIVYRKQVVDKLLNNNKFDEAIDIITKNISSNDDYNKIFRTEIQENPNVKDNVEELFTKIREEIKKFYSSQKFPATTLEGNLVKIEEYQVKSNLNFTDELNPAWETIFTTYEKNLYNAVRNPLLSYQFDQAVSAMDKYVTSINKRMESDFWKNKYSQKSNVEKRYTSVNDLYSRMKGYDKVGDYHLAGIFISGMPQGSPTNYDIIFFVIVDNNICASGFLNNQSGSFFINNKSKNALTWQKGKKVTIELYQNKNEDRQKLKNNKCLIGEYTFTDQYTLFTAVNKGVTFSRKGPPAFGVYTQGRKAFDKAQVTVKFQFSPTQGKMPFSGDFLRLEPYPQNNK